jgi:hypothetical protein
MQYVLGNMLNGGGINPDGLSLDLQFAADKTLTARRGPTPVFTRSSGDNGGTTYFGPLVDFDLLYEIPATGITNGRASWFKSDGGIDITISYTGTRWRAVVVDNGNTDEFLAAPGSEWRPDQADWSGQDFSVTTSSTFGIVNAANNEPRFDHDPVTGVCRGLLIEEGRTNLFSSTNLNDWSAARVTRTPITGIGLTNQATTLTRSEIGSSYIFRGATLTTGVAYAISVRVKAGTMPTFSIADFTDSKFSRLFNLSTSQWAASGGSAEFTNYTVTPNIDGWFLVSVIYTPTGATGAKNIVFELYGVVGDTVSLDTPQIEAGSFPTSYIPTTTGSVARSADVCNITGANFNNFYNQSEGTMFAESLKTTGPASNSHICGPSNGSFAEFIDLRYLSDTLLQSVTNHLNVTQFAVNRAYTLNAITRQAIAYALNDAAYCAQGGVVTVDVPPYTPPVVTLFHIGSAGSGLLKLNGCVRAIRYYKKRLPNAKLVTLTT